MTDDITLISPTADELRDWIQPLVAAFYEEFTEAAFESERPLFEPSRLVGAFAGERRIGSGGAFSVRLTVPGSEVPVSAITAIGVLPDHRRRGVLRRMMDWLVADALERGEPIAVLWASEAAIYRRFGFGHGTLTSYLEVERARVAFRTPHGPWPRAEARVRLVDADEALRLFVPIYETVRAAVPGSLSRHVRLWKDQLLPDAEWMHRGDGPKHLAVLEVDGEARGFAIYRIKSEWDPLGPAGRLSVTEVVGLDADAELALWQWLFSQDLVTTIRARRQPSPHPLQQWVVEPRRLGVTVGDGLWLRLLDLPAALAARRYAGQGALVLEVRDELLPANTGRWEVVIQDGRADVIRTTAEPDLTLDIAELASAYLGALRFIDLERAGLVHAAHPDSAQTADALFTPPRAPFCNTMF